jgi:glutamate 5-kinase
MLQFIKIGSGCLFDEKGEIDYKTLRKKAREIESLDYGNVLVVSGAIALGKKMRGEKRSNADLDAVELQGYACTGQIELMDVYRSLFNKDVAQLLLTEYDLKHRNHVKDLICHNIKNGVITLVNYNDGVDFKQLRKDNDTLAAKLLTYCNGDRLVILGRTYDGLKDKEGGIVERVTAIDRKLYDMCDGKSFHGNGGFKTKLDAAKMVLGAGKEMLVGNIGYSLQELIEGSVQRTLFKAYAGKQLEDEVRA